MILSKLYEQVSQLASKTGIIILFISAHTVLILMMLFTFPKINAQLGTQAFDLRAGGYSHEEAVTMVRSLDDATRSLYLFPQIFLLDLLYPVLLALLLSALIIRLSKLINLKEHIIYSNFFLLPFIAMDFDYLENILVALMISGKTDPSALFVHIASTSTLLKGLFTTVSWLIIIVLFVIWLFRKRKA